MIQLQGGMIQLQGGSKFYTRSGVNSGQTLTLLKTARKLKSGLKFWAALYHIFF